MTPFYLVFSEVAERETRMLHTRNNPDLPDGS